MGETVIGHPSLIYDNVEKDAVLMQPAEKRLGRGDTPRQCFGTAWHVAFVLHPFEVTVEVLRGDPAEGDILREETGQQTHI